MLVLFAVGTTLEALALDRSRRSVEALTELAPEEAQVLVDGVERTVAVAEIAPGAVLRVRPGERVPLDGDIVEGASSLDESALTGESVPVDKGAGDAVFAGTLNAFGALTIRTTASAADTTLARVARLVAEAQGSRAPTERFIDRFARIYTPLVFVAALLLAVVPVLLGGDLDTWLYRALALLIVACPCALVISVPVAVVSAVGGAARAGVLIKGGEALEALGRIDTVAVDKTGTLTEGRPRLASIEVARTTEDRALALVAAVEQGSEHPLGQTLLRAAHERRLDVPAAHAFTALPGRGAEATVDGRALWAGGPRLAAERTGARLPRRRSWPSAARRRSSSARARASWRCSGSRTSPARGGATRSPPCGATACDAWSCSPATTRPWRAPSPRASASRSGAPGCSRRRSSTRCARCSATAAWPWSATASTTRPRSRAPTSASPWGRPAATSRIETADVALMADELQRLPDAVGQGRRTLRIIRQNVVASLAVKAVFVVLAPLGLTTLVLAVVADMGTSLAVTLNALRLLRRS